MILDTAAGLTTVTSPLVDELGLAPLGTAPQDLYGAAGSKPVTLYSLGSVDVAGWRVPAPLTIVLDRVMDIAPGARGILGNNVLAAFNVDIDQRRDRLTLLPRGERPRDDRRVRWRKVDAYRTAGYFMVLTVRVNGVEARGLLDTGANRTILNGPLAEALGLFEGEAAGVEPGAPIRGTTADAAPSLRTTLETLEMGGREWNDLPVAVADLPVFRPLGLDSMPALLLGNDVLKDLRVFIDYGAETVEISR